MTPRTRQVSYFLSSQYFSDGLRTTLSILLPALVWAQFGDLRTGLALSLGALSVSLSDAPGPVLHRRNGMLATVLITFVVTLITGLARMNPYALAVEIFTFSFLFSLFSVWGNRAASVGTAAILIMILMLDRPLDWAGVVMQSGLVLAGGAWYTAISLLLSRLQPYLLAKQAVGQCIHEMAKLMSIKAEFYNPDTVLEADYRRFIAQQVVVSEKQDAVREVLFKSRRIVTESTQTGRQLLLTFVDVVDLYEQIIAMYYDYSDLRDRFGKTDVLAQIARLMRQLGSQLDHIGLAVQSPLPLRKSPDIGPLLADLKRSIDASAMTRAVRWCSKKYSSVCGTISQRMAAIEGNLSQSDTEKLAPDTLEYGRFVSHQVINVDSFRGNLTFDSSAFRHSARVALAMLLGFVITKFLPYGHHSYWVLLTISVILKPAFSLTQQRNIERIGGTLVGGFIGVLILTLVTNTTVQFGLMVLLMLGTYSTIRINYRIMVVCLTAFVLILFSFLGASYVGVAQERFLDTLLGGIIALVAGYAFFPKWESEQVASPMQAVLKANIRFVQLLLDSLTGQPLDVVAYKLARKDVFVASANVGATFDRMLSEPKHKQRNERLVYEFVVLNYVLSANVATIASARLTGEHPAQPPALLRPVKRALLSLTDSLHRLSPASEAANPNTANPEKSTPEAVPADSALLEQLRFIQKISGDIGKLAERMEL